MAEPRCMWCNKRLPVDPTPDGELKATVTCRYCRKQTVIQPRRVVKV